ncbi:MAG: nucleotidyltransferase family protein [Lachnospiraceae bacterium]|nr:nucleotidyltransferase family protein [Lachnospiraceae bacterium]
MKTVGIIAEFNPFHNGHKYLIEKVKEITGADTAVIIMSGDFVQRGAPAVCDKFLRTSMALYSGADIVFELPTVYALGSAETFADGAVRLLSSTLNIDFICFGSECGNIDTLYEFAVNTEDYSNTEEFRQNISAAVKQGMSYPAAFESVIKEKINTTDSTLYLPNNLLGIEYCRALYRLKKSGIYTKLPELITVKRTGSSYHDEMLSEYPSATSVRNALKNNDIGILRNCLPETAYNMLNDNIGKSLPIFEDDFSDMLYMRLNSASDEDIRSIPDIHNDLKNKLINCRGKQVVISELIAGLKCKAFTYSAISRAVFKLLLSPMYANAFQYISDNTGSTKAYLSADDGITKVPYIRVLGFKKDSSEFLRTLRNSETCNIITKPADGNMDDPSYLLDIYAANLYNQVCSNKYKTGFTDELKTGPVIIL